jgi:FecR protein
MVRRIRILLPALWLALGILGAVEALAQPSGAVARVAVSVGDTRKVGSQGLVESLKVGSTLAAGERVRTGPDAMAILVFSDEGRISLRADSELLIRHYEIDPTGAKTRIELELIKGTVRQISGQASRAQPDRYRLNTPIAVIGVRGTDFLAKTAGDAVEAFVHEGNIVLTPHAGACAASSSAACDPVAVASSVTGSRYVRLNATGQVEHREFRPGELEKVFGIELARASRQPGGVAGRSPSLGDDFQLPIGTRFISDTIFVAQGAADLQLASVAVPPTPGATASNTPTPSVEPAPALPPPGPAAPPADASTSNPVPSVPETQPPAAQTVSVAPVLAALPKQLVWGRFSMANALPVDLLLPYTQASQGRHVTVGELGQYALWREDPSGRLDPSLKGQAEFQLAGASAELVQVSGITAASVTRASLSVDFDRSTFAAAVGLNHQATGDAQLAVTGKVNVEGVFVGTNQTDRVAGALSRDGKEAGYLFSKDVTAGTFRGITLWGRK